MIRKLLLPLIKFLNVLLESLCHFYSPLTNHKNLFFSCTSWIKQVDWKSGLSASTFLFALIFSVYGTLNFLHELITVGPKNTLVKEFNALVIEQQKFIEPMYKAEVETILTTECLYPDNLSKTIYNNKGVSYSYRYPLLSTVKQHIN